MLLSNTRDIMQEPAFEDPIVSYSVAVDVNDLQKFMRGIAGKVYRCLSSIGILDDEVPTSWNLDRDDKALVCGFIPRF